MRVSLVKTFIGIFALDEKRKVILFKPFPKDHNVIAEKMADVEPIEMQEIKSQLKDTKEFITDDKEAESFVRQNLLKYALEKGFAKDNIEFNQLMTKVNSELSKQKIRESASRDGIIIHVNHAIEELDKSINVFTERLRELYSLHFPEMERMIDDHEKFAKLIEKFGDRKNIDDKQVNHFKEKSSGMEFTTDDIDAVKLLATEVIKMYELRSHLSDYQGKLVKEVAPNFVALAGDVIAARLISKSGGLERLSRMPSSTIQLLGSEKALFRFLKSRGRSKSPKYGLIYNHPLIQNSPASKQGKLARLLSSKLSIAARIDYYSKDYKADEMKKDLEKKAKEILSSKE